MEGSCGYLNGMLRRAMRAEGVVLLMLASQSGAAQQCLGYQLGASNSGPHVQWQVIGSTVGAPQACYPMTLAVWTNFSVLDYEDGFGVITIPYNTNDQNGTSGWTDWTYEGVDISVQGEWATQCYGGLQWSGGTCPFPTPTFYPDQLEPEAFAWALQSGCAGGTQRLVLTDLAGETGNMVSAVRAAGVNYQVKLNSAVIASGSLSSRFVASPPSFMFDGLAPGAYDIVFTDAGITDAFAYWNVPTAWPRFAIPVVGDCGINLPVRLMLDGAAPLSGSGTLMRDDLRVAGVVPPTEPYSALGYAYVGSAPGASIAPALLSVTGANAIVDWVVVELRSASNPAVVIESRAGLVQRDGEVMDTNGEAWLNFAAPPGNYHVAVRHRNHLAVRTATAVACEPSTFGVDFTRPGIAYGTSPTKDNTYLGQTLWSGDAGSNGSLKYTGSGNDRDLVLLTVGSTTPNNVVGNTYSTRDVNLNGQVKYTGTGNDRDVILSNVGSSTPNAVRVQQVP